MGFPIIWFNYKTLSKGRSSFIKIPLGKGPYKIEYLVNGIKVDEYEFESLMEYWNIALNSFLIPLGIRKELGNC